MTKTELIKILEKDKTANIEIKFGEWGWDTDIKINGERFEEAYSLNIAATADKHSPVIRISLYDHDEEDNGVVKDYIDLKIVDGVFKGKMGKGKVLVGEEET